MNGKQTTTKNSQRMVWWKQRLDDVAGNAAYDVVKWILGVFLLVIAPVIWLIQQFGQAFLSIQLVITGRIIVLTVLLVLGLAVIQQFLFTRKRRLDAEKREQITDIVLTGRDQQIGTWRKNS